MDDAREAALLAGVLAAPDDDAPRLIYADHLIERGDPRGELIQVECALATAPPKDPRRVDLGLRATELRAQCLPRFAALVEHAWFETRRGFIDRVVLEPQVLARCLPALIATHPVRRLEIPVRNDVDVEIAAEIEIPSAIEVVLTGDARTPTELDLDSPAVDALLDSRARLALHHVNARHDQWFALLGSPACARIRAVELAGCSIPGSAIATLADPRVLPAFDDLAITVRPWFDLGLGTDELIALGARLVRLADLTWMGLDEARRGMASLLAKSRLRELDYRRATRSQPVIDAIAASPNVQTVRTLGIWLDRPELLAAILDSPHLADLVDLHVEPVPEPEHLAGFASVLRAHRDRDLVLHWDRAPPALREVAPELFAIPPPIPPRRK